MVKNRSEKKQEIKEIFAAIAPFYDVMNIIMTWGLVNKWRTFLVKTACLIPGETVLDIGTGTGEQALLMAKKVGLTGRVIGVDLCEEMLEVARYKARALKDNENLALQFLKGQADSLPFSPDSFDCVVSAFVMRNVDNLEQMIAEMVRVCKKEGRVVCLEISYPNHPVVEAGFNLYFHYYVPFLGMLVERGLGLNNSYPPYTWLSDSLRVFPAVQEVVNTFTKAGLRTVKSIPLHGGIVSIYWGIKRD